MADPVSIIGLIGAIVGILDVSMRIGKQAKDLSSSRDDLPRDLKNSEILAADLGNVLSKLQNNRRAGDEDMLEIVKVCQKQTDVLQAVLDKLKYAGSLGQDEKPSYLRNVGRALRIRRKEEEVRKLRATITDFEQRLAFRLSVRIYERNEEISQKLDALALAFDRQTKALEELKEAARIVAMEGPRTKVRESLTLPGLSSRAASQVTEVSLLRLSRPVAACPRCHNANQQCDGKLPACTNCKSSGLAAQCAADSKLLGELEGKNLGPTASAPGPDTIIGTPQNGLTARVGNMALSINWNVSYEKGDPGTTASSWLQYVGSKFLPAPSSSADHDVQINTQRTARVRIKITSDDGKPLVREITCPSIMTRAEFFRRVSSILERQKSMNEKLDEIAAIISDGHNTLSGKDRRRMETSINAHLLRHHASMFGENQGDGASRAYIVSTSRDTNWYLETKDIAPHWQRVNYLNAAIHIPGLIFLYLSPPRRLAILLPWSSIQTRLCDKYDICTHQQRIAALSGGFEAHDFFMLWLVAYIAFQIWFYTINRNFYIHGTGYEFNIMLAPALYERVVNYHVNLMLMLFAIWDLGEEMWESIQTVYEELSCGRLTSSVLRASTLKLVGNISGITVLGVLVYYAQLWMEGLTILAVLIWSVLAYVFLVTLWEQRGLDVLRQRNKISGWLS